MERVKIAALVPMRHSSERVPGKNYRPMAGKPLFHYILETLQAVPEITHILVDTDSPTILNGVAEHFPSVIALERPPHLLHKVRHTSGNFWGRGEVLTQDFL